MLLSPAHSYPSGVVLSADRRVKLLEWARQTGALVIEDDYDAEFRYDRTPVGALQGPDPRRVVYGGTASKVLSPARRLGWLVAPPELTSEIILAKFLEDHSAEALGQLTLARLIDSGGRGRDDVNPVLPVDGHCHLGVAPQQSWAAHSTRPSPPTGRPW